MSYKNVTKKPITRRHLSVLVTMLLLPAPCFSSAAAVRSTNTSLLTAQAAVRIGLSRPAVRQITRGRISAALSQVTEAATWPNPRLHYQYEESSPGRGSTSDAYLWLTQEFDFSGRRGFRIEAAKERVQATQKQIEYRLLGRATKIRQHFYRVLYRQALQQIINRWYERLQAIESVIRKREAAGVISGYDRLRLTREQAAVRVRLQSAAAVYRRTWEQLLGILALARVCRAFLKNTYPTKRYGSFRVCPTRRDSDRDRARRTVPVAVWTFG